MYSVIIPAKNESKNIARCIQSVLNSVKDRSSIEVIVVDNGSFDTTVEIAKKEGARVFVRKNVNISALRNFGVEKASYNIIGFIDADCDALPGWIENARKILSDNLIGIVGDYYRLPDEPKWIEKAYFSSILRKRREVSYLSGGNMVIRKDNFLNVGGFDERVTTGEDYVLCLKFRSAGFKIIADPSVSVIHHGNPKTLTQLFKKEIWHGLGMFDLYKYGKVTLPLIWSLLNIILFLCILMSLILNLVYSIIIIISIFLLLPGGAVLVRSWRNKSYKQPLLLYIFFVVYGLARTVSILKLGSRYIFSIMRT